MEGQDSIFKLLHACLVRQVKTRACTGKGEIRTKQHSCCFRSSLVPVSTALYTFLRDYQQCQNDVIMGSSEAFLTWGVLAVPQNGLLGRASVSTDIWANTILAHHSVDCRLHAAALWCWACALKRGNGLIWVLALVPP